MIVRYGPHRDQFAELRLPTSRAGSSPVAVLLHGGFWRAPYLLDQMNALGDDLALRGWAAYNVEYRRIGDGGGYRNTTADVLLALDALERHASVLDLDRVIVLGHSAGGFLALTAAIDRPGSSSIRPAGAVAMAGLCDLEMAIAGGIGAGSVEQFLSDDGGERVTDPRSASPLGHSPLGIPQLLVHGTADDEVPLELTQAYAAAARAAGDHVDVEVIAGEDHFAHLDPRSASWSAVARWLTRFG